MSAPKKIPPATQKRMFFWFNWSLASRENEFEFEYLTNLFDQANSVILIHHFMYSNRDSTAQFPFARALISEMNTFRHGLLNLSKNRAKIALKGKHGAREVLIKFDEYFLKVREHRNILQHFGEYLFGDSKSKPVQKSEINRFGIEIELQPGQRVTSFSENIVGDMLVSSNRKGKLVEVYIGPDLRMRIAEILFMACKAFEARYNTKISLIADTTEEEVRAVKMGTHSYFKPEK